MTVGLIIFDCDGVLVDSEPVANRILCETLNEIGIPLDEATAHRYLVGRSLAHCFEWIERQFDCALPVDFEDQLQGRTYDAFVTELRPVAGIIDVLDLLALPFCVASSGKQEKMKVTLTATGLWSRFQGRIFSAAQVARGKPCPDLFLFAASQMGVAPEQAVVVEDSVAGVEAARAAGMRVFGYIGGTFAQPLAQAGAEVFDDMSELPVLIDLEQSGGKK